MLTDDLKKIVKGEVADDAATLEKFSHDASLFEVKPRVVVAPKDSEDIKNLVKFVSENKESQPELSLTARSGGTDMTGGSINDSIILDFTAHFNQIKEVSNGYAITQPGVYYRDFEKETLKSGQLLPSYPASREICAIGGMVNNNSGGEKTLKYGKTEQYVEDLKVVLADGNEYHLKKFNKKELDAKMKQKNFEGLVYKKVFDLVNKNYDLVKGAKPKVSKNSMGYNLWDVWDKEKEEFNLAKLFVGSQGTLGITTEATFRLVRAMPESGLLVVFLTDLNLVDDVVREINPLKPTSFESFDDKTFKLAVKFFWSFAKHFGWNMFSLAWQFLPDVWLMLTGGFPRLTLLIEFESDTRKDLQATLEEARSRVSKYKFATRIAPDRASSKKYWLIRRESFNLLRQRVKGYKTAPFIDDVIVHPDKLPEFLPKLYAILEKYEFIDTIAGHVGDGNFHVIPLMKLEREEERAKIPKAMDEINKLTLEFGGSLSAEHNEGLVRGPYSRQQFGDQVYKLFEETKKIFDPLGIFNPRKKVGADLTYTLARLKQH